MRIPMKNKCGVVTLFTVLMISLLLGSVVAMGELHSATNHLESNVHIIDSEAQFSQNFRPRERRLVQTVLIWCIARSNISDVNLQQKLDWACGPLENQGQANCGPANVGGACFDPDTTWYHTSWAFNEYFQRVNSTLKLCDLNGTATLTTTDPSQNTCVFKGSNVTVDANLTSVIGALPPASSPVLAPGPAPISVTMAFEPNYFIFCVSTAVTLLITHLFT